MSWQIWLGFYVAIALAVGIVGANIIRAIEKQGELTRETLDGMKDEIVGKLDEINTTLSSEEGE